MVHGQWVKLPARLQTSTRTWRSDCRDDALHRYRGRPAGPSVDPCAILAAAPRCVRRLSDAWRSHLGQTDRKDR
jgi:hypothetical protein